MTGPRTRARLVALVTTGALLATGCAGDLGTRVDPPRGESGPGTRVDFRGGADPVVVVAAGDISDCAPPGCPAARTARRVLRIDPDLVLALGDTQYPTGRYRAYLAEYDRTWGQFLGRTRPAPGNHEYHHPRAGGYFRYFGRRAGNSERGYHSFDAGRWHLIALNTGDGSCRPVRCGPGSRQVRWLRRDLRRTDRNCLLAYWHHPPWSTGQHGDNVRVRALWRVAARHDTDVVLTGHDHNYERYARRGAAGNPAAGGPRQFVVGTGGADLRPFRSRAGALTEKRISGHHGVLKLRLANRSYDWSFRTASGRVLDAGGPVRCR